PTPTPTPTPAPSPTPTSTPTPGPTPTPTPPVVISEFRTHGPSGANDEFIKIYNNSDNAIDLSLWKIRSSNNAGSISTRLTIANGTMLPARSHFLAINNSGSGYSRGVVGSQTSTSRRANDGA